MEHISSVMGRVMKGIEKTVMVKGSPEPIEVIALASGRELRIFDHGDRIEIRIFKPVGRGWGPTRQGLSIPLEQFGQLVSALIGVKINLVETKREVLSDVQSKA